VQVRRGHEPARLVPLGLIDSAASGIRVNATLAEFGRLDPAEETRFIEGGMDVPDYRSTDVVSWPYFGYRGARGGLATSDAIPVGEVEIRRGEHIHATDGLVGRVPLAAHPLRQPGPGQARWHGRPPIALIAARRAFAALTAARMDGNVMEPYARRIP
jgi:hypothetical protein